MIDSSSGLSGLLADPAALVAAGTALGAGGKWLLEWWGNRNREQVKDQLTAVQQALAAADALREDLVGQNRELRGEVAMLRQELAAARTELREFGTMHLRTVADWQQKYGDLLGEVAQLRATISTLKSA